MKLILLTLLLLLSAFSVAAQMFSSSAEVLTVYSQNGEYYLRSTPWDNEEPSLRGTTSVYRKDSNEPIYSFERGFDSAKENRLIISNNGEVIFYVIPWSADEIQDGLKSVSIYKNGKIVESFTEHDLTGCDHIKERCNLLYNNYEEVVDEKKTRASGKTVFKDGVSDDERFLYGNSIFSSGNIVYLIDPKKNVHKFDLSTQKNVGSVPLNSIFDTLKSLQNTKVESQRFDTPTFLDFPNLSSGKNTYQVLAKALGMTVYNWRSEKDEIYKSYRFKLKSYLKRDGSIEVENIELLEDLPKEKILAVFSSNKFDATKIPSVAVKWHIKDEYFYFRKTDNSLAKNERQIELAKQREDLKKRLVSETIGDHYIPKDLGDAFQQLDKELPEIVRKEMTALVKRDDMITYHMGLGMWMRNNWGLWGGSRLQKYFIDKGFTHPDNMSSVILFYYWDWLHDKKGSWKEWEKNPKSVFEKG